MLLDGKRIMITGASRGLGREMCAEFARQGATRIAFNYSKDEKGAAETLAAIEEGGAEGKAYRVSVLDPEGLNEVAQDLEKSWEGVDVLVNNAGVSQPLPLALLEEEDWDKVMDINVKGTYLATRALIRGMIRRRRGRVLNVSSLAGVRLIEAPIHYCASKAALQGFTRSLSKEVARYGVRVNCIAPGLLEDGVSVNLPDHRLKQFLEHVSLQRRGTLEEVAKFAGFMISDRNSYMNGETVVIDGGL